MEAINGINQKISKVPQKVHVYTFGCRANQYDTAAIEHNLKNDNFMLVSNIDQADAVVINSCSITDAADNEAQNLIQKVKNKNPALKVVLTGCAVHAENKSKARWALADGVVDNHHKDQIGLSLRSNQHQPLLINSKDRFQAKDIFFAGGIKLSGHTRSFLKIQDGCSQFCSFCIVPYARGRNRSLDIQKILASIQELDQKGLPEVVLTGIHLGTYGVDLNPKLSLNYLLKEITKLNLKLKVRLSSIDPEEIDEEFFDIFAHPIFCKHLHIPMQSGDDTILKRMRRRYTSKQFFDLGENLVKRFPQICLGTDVIVGFPGESNESFALTLSLLQKSRLAYWHVFSYALKKGTPAAEFRDQVDRQVIKKRARLLRDFSDKKRLEFESQFDGQLIDAVIEKRKKGIVALTENYIAAKLHSEDGLEPGMSKKVLLQKKGQNLFAHPVLAKTFLC